jgi:hypothetical protein
VTAPVPVIPLDDVLTRIRRHSDPFLYNPHAGIYAPSRSGKTWLIRYGLLKDCENERVVVLDVKPGGDRSWRGWGNDVSSLRPGFGRGDDGTAHYRLMVQRGERGKDQVKRTLEMIANEGACVVVADDSRRITANAPAFALPGLVDGLMNEGAGIGVTMILAANSVTWAVSSLREGCGYYLVGPFQSEDQQKRLIEVTGLPREHRATLGNLKRHQFLYSDIHNGSTILAITGVSDGRQK